MRIILLCTFVLALLCSDPFLFSQTNTPCGATVLTVGSTTCTNTAGTTVGATYSSNAANGGTPSCAAPGAPDVWFSFVVPPSGSVTIQGTAGSMTDGAMALYNGPCTAPTQVECDDDDGPGFMPMISRSGLTPGATMYIRFWRYSSGTGTFSICIVENHADCNQFLPICSGSSFNSNSFGPGSVAESFPCAAAEAQSMWIQFQIFTSGTLTFSITPQNGTDDYDWALYQSNSPTFCSNVNSTSPVSCNASSSLGAGGSTGLATSGHSGTNNVGPGPGNPFNPAINVTAGQTYYLHTDNFSASSSGFNLSFGGTASLNCGILPVEVFNFEGFEDQGNIRLNWQVGEEQLFNQYVIEKYADVWEEIGKVPAAGGRKYDFLDVHPAAGKNIYRLRLEDRDGSVSYSETAVVFINPDDAVVVYPNPGMKSFSVKGNVSYPAVIKLRDATGRLVIEREIAANELVETSGLDAGMYFWEIRDAAGSRTSGHWVKQ